MQDLAELEAIKQLKYRYIRCLDLKLWDEMAECLCEDVRSAYGDGRYTSEGRDALLAFRPRPAPGLAAPRMCLPQGSRARGTLAWRQERLRCDAIRL